MVSRRVPILDSTPSLLATGFSWLPSRWRRSGRTAVRARLLGKPAIAVRGPEAVPFFYDEHRVLRSGAVPKAVQRTLFGEGAVQTLDGEEHRVRKAMFLGLLTDPNRVAALGQIAARSWEDAARQWASRPSVVLFDETARVITAAACEWAGVRLPGEAVPARARQLVATVDGFATPSLRHWRARLARNRLERWLTRVIVATRNGSATPVTELAGAEPVVEVVAHHRDADGSLRHDGVRRS